VLKGIVFDLDGTLIDSYDAIAESLNHALAGLGRPALPVAQVRRMVGEGLEVLIGKALALNDGTGTDDDIALGVRLFRQRYDAVCEARTSLLPGVGATLPVLRRRGYRMTVATNKPSYFATRLLESLGAAVYFAAVLGPDLVTHAKPHPEMIRAALAAMSLGTRDAVYVGDMPLDLVTAREAGLPVIVLSTGSSSEQELRAAGAELVLSSFDQLLDRLPDTTVP